MQSVVSSENTPCSGSIGYGTRKEQVTEYNTLSLQTESALSNSRPGRPDDASEMSTDGVDLSLEEGHPPMAITMDKLPPLPSRPCAYYLQPLIGILIVCGACSLLNSATVHGTVRHQLVLLWSAVALACSMVLLFVEPSGQVHRSKLTCYPIPDEVVAALNTPRGTCGMSNIAGPMDSRSLGTYCVRCLVWRPACGGDDVHHCQVCQRCYVGYDHHCSLFGRCIAQGNFIFFYGMILMLPMGCATVFFDTS